MLEILIALTIFAVGLLAVATMQVSAIHENALGYEVTRASFLAQDKLEQLKNSADIASEADGVDQDGIFSRSWTIEAGTGNAQLARVTVAWTRRGNSHSVVFRTLTRGDGE